MTVAHFNVILIAVSMEDLVADSSVVRMVGYVVGFFFKKNIKIKVFRYSQKLTYLLSTAQGNLMVKQQLQPHRELIITTEMKSFPP